MKRKLFTILAIMSFLTLSVAQATETINKKMAIKTGVLAGIYVEKNKENILSWSRLTAYKTLKNEAQKYNCIHTVKPSKNGTSEYIRGLCTFVNENKKQDVFEGLNALSYAVLNTKNDDIKCATALAFFTTKNYKVYKLLMDQSKINSKLCHTAKNIVKIGLQHEIKFHGILEAGNVCVE